MVWTQNLNKLYYLVFKFLCEIWSTVLKMEKMSYSNARIPAVVCGLCEKTSDPCDHIIMPPKHLRKVKNFGLNSISRKSWKKVKAICWLKCNLPVCWDHKSQINVTTFILYISLVWDCVWYASFIFESILVFNCSNFIYEKVTALLPG